MGYRSDVAFFIQGQTEEIMPILVAYRLAGGVEEKKALSGCAFQANGDLTSISFRGDGIKWYDEYEDVIALKKLYKAFESTEKFDCCFARVGENEDDIERTYTNEGYDAIYIRTELSCDFNHMPTDTLEKLLGETT